MLYTDDYVPIRVMSQPEIIALFKRLNFTTSDGASLVESSCFLELLDAAMDNRDLATFRNVFVETMREIMRGRR